jgi:chitodextrinase
LHGVIFVKGTAGHVPPDQASQLNSLAPIGARVQVSGWIHTGPLGDTHVDATTITNSNNRATMGFQTPPPPPGPGAPLSGPPDPNAAGAPPPPPAPSPVVPQPAPVSSNPGADTTVTGVVRSFNYGAAGEVNGVILDQGTVVYFPPEQAGQVAQLVRVGSRIRVHGWVRQGPAGNALIGAETMTNRTTGNSISVADQPPPPPR